MARKRQPTREAAAQPAATDEASKNKSAATREVDDPLALLRYEHRTLDSLFTQFGLRKERQLAERLCAALEAHFRLEQTFYAEAEAIPEIHGRVDTAVRERGAMEDQMLALVSLGEGDALNEQMLTLQRAVEQHIRDEERTIFPAVVKSLSRQRVRELGTSLRLAKTKLLEAQDGPSTQESYGGKVADREGVLAS